MASILLFGSPVLRLRSSLLCSGTRALRPAAAWPAVTSPFSASSPSSLSSSLPGPFSGHGARSLSVSAGRASNFTSDTYPDLKRETGFAELTKDHVAYFRGLLGNDNAVIDAVSSNAALDDIEPFNVDWTRKYQGHCRLVLKPGTTLEVSKILQYCSQSQIAVVPQGGNTGLVGGSVPVFDEIVISMGRMNRIRSFDHVSGIVVVDAGAILEVVNNELAQKGHIFPLDLGAKGTCQIGGNVSTNAGGLRLLRYGSLHGTVLGIEAVLPDGTIVDDLSKLRKNNTGYDMKQLFIGAEGTLGIVTGVSVICPQKPQAVNVAFLGLSSFQQAQQAFKEAKHQLGEILSAFELMDEPSIKLVHKFTNGKRPLADSSPFYCLVETSGSNSDHDTEKLEAFLQDVMEKEIVADGVVAQDQTQIDSLWKWREGIAEWSGGWGGVYKYDVSIPLHNLYRLVDDTRERIKKSGLMGDTDDHPVVDVVGYGHMGDSNLHLNVLVRRYDKSVENMLEPWVYEWIAREQGSISAEHGLGIAKKKYIGFSRSPTVIKLMKQIKKVYDPHGIMNPYKYM